MVYSGVLWELSSLLDTHGRKDSHMQKGVTHTQSTDRKPRSLLLCVWRGGTEQRPPGRATLACPPQRSDLGLGSGFFFMVFFLKSLYLPHRCED